MQMLDNYSCVAIHNYYDHYEKDKSGYTKAGLEQIRKDFSFLNRESDFAKTNGIKNSLPERMLKTMKQYYGKYAA